MPKGLLVFGYIFAFCFVAVVVLFAFWYSSLVRTAGVYSITEVRSCDVLFLNSDGTYGQRVQLYNEGRLTNTIWSKGRWQSIDKTHLVLSGPEFLDENGIHKYTAPVSAETTLRSGIFHTLSVHTPPRDLTYDRPFSGSTACWMVGMS